MMEKILLICGNADDVLRHYSTFKTIEREKYKQLHDDVYGFEKKQRFQKQSQIKHEMIED